MLKITTIEQPQQRILRVEGELAGPWVSELRAAWNDARQARQGRIVVDLKDATAISEEGGNLLREMMSQGAQFACHGVFTRHVLRELARSCRRKSL